MACAGSITLEAAFPNTSSEHADRGTACHTVAAECLRSTELVPMDWLDDKVNVANPGEPARYVVFDEDLCEMTTGYVNEIKEISRGYELFVEKRVKYLDDEFGTIDAHWLRQIEVPFIAFGQPGVQDGYEIVICDLKTGYKFVGTDSPQLKCYALGVLALYELSHDVTQIRLMIYQPRHGGMREEVITVAELREFEEKVRAAAAKVDEAQADYAPMYANGQGGLWMSAYLNPDPNEEECAFCRALPTCGAAQAKLERVVGAAFDVISENDAVSDPVEVVKDAVTRLGIDENGDEVVSVDTDRLGEMMACTGFLEDWIKAVRAETERHLLLGQPVAGYGLELGRQGNRAWKDDEEVERMLRKQFRIKIEDAFNFKLKSPTQVEKLAAAPTKKNPTPAALTPVQWAKLQKLISRSDAVPSVKPAKQIKTPYSVVKPTEDAFEEVAENGLKPPAADNEIQLW